ncbi:hypothetical protein DPX39_070066300 [Trypanosoma brucei equiperdum]|uniref:Oxidation resistance protein 1 n=1 Tax=Trypanosoma brucei equiperdum TaxID=630700 RepID=A0A3L6L6V9_9TRYP|nr:hypothetical protein DPX39_070066300 [Trypanosoma brucei equiperdum]
MVGKCPRQPFFYRTPPPGVAVRVKQPTTSFTDCSCCLDLDALFPNRRPSPPLPLTRCEYHELLMALPPHLHHSPWDTCFDTEQDGFSLQNFYRTMKEINDDGDGGIGIFVVTKRAPECGEPTQRHSDVECESGIGNEARSCEANQVVLGCFTPQVPCLGRSQHAFFGTGETFVFTYADMNDVDARRSRNIRDELSSAVNFPGCEEDSEAGSDAVHKHTRARKPTVNSMLSTYTWVGKESNKRFVVCARDFFGIGRGRDGAAIYIDENILFGTSSMHCATFDSPPLCGWTQSPLPHSEFTVMRMLWFRVGRGMSILTDVKLLKQLPCDCGRRLERNSESCTARVLHAVDDASAVNKASGWHLCAQ